MNPAFAPKAGLIEITQRQRGFHTRYCFGLECDRPRVAAHSILEWKATLPEMSGHGAFRED
jgi:hypothetical protein